MEDLLTGRLPGVPRLVLHHSVLSTESGSAFIKNYEMAANGELNAPYVVIYEGSIADERLSAAHGGYWSAMGAGTDHQPIPTATWLKRMAPGAAAVIAIGTCATWGGIPAAIGNPTGAMGVMDFLGEDYRSVLGLPVVNIPGCSPVGDNFSESGRRGFAVPEWHGTVAEFINCCPAWLFGEKCTAAARAPAITKKAPLPSITATRNASSRLAAWGSGGAVQHHFARGDQSHGRLHEYGRHCTGCTMPGFPDRFSPFYNRPPGTIVSSSMSRTTGTFVKPLRRITQHFANRETRWDREQHVPSGWGHASAPSRLEKTVHYFYEKWQFLNGERPWPGPKQRYSPMAMRCRL